MDPEPPCVVWKNPAHEARGTKGKWCGALPRTIAIYTLGGRAAASGPWAGTVRGVEHAAPRPSPPRRAAQRRGHGPRRHGFSGGWDGVLGLRSGLGRVVAIRHDGASTREQVPRAGGSMGPWAHRGGCMVLGSATWGAAEKRARALALGLVGQMLRRGCRWRWCCGCCARVPAQSSWTRSGSAPSDRGCVEAERAPF